MIIELVNVRKRYALGKVGVEALRGVTLSIRQGDFVAVAGPSGSGKTTLMNVIGLIDTPTSGSARLCGRETADLGREERTRLRRDTLGFIFQSFNLLPVLSVFENVELPLLLGRPERGRRGRARRRERVETLLEAVGLMDRRDHRPTELSGGQQQRAAIARALVANPAVVIADEPTANLDTENGERVLGLMKKLNAENGTTFIFSTHDASIWQTANHVVFLRDGSIRSESRA